RQPARPLAPRGRAGASPARGVAGRPARRASARAARGGGGAGLGRRRRRAGCAVAPLVERALEQLGEEAGRVSVVVAGEPEIVRADAAQIERVLVNVLETALKFSSPTDAVEVSAARDAARVSIRVRDHGPGVLE